MRDRTSAWRAAALITGPLLLLGCRDDLNQDRTASSMLADSAIVASLTMPDTIGRIIYEPPADLSMASAMTKRPDLFKAVVKTANANAETGSRKSPGPAGAAGTRP